MKPLNYSKRMFKKVNEIVVRWESSIAVCKVESGWGDIRLRRVVEVIQPNPWLTMETESLPSLQTLGFTSTGHHEVGELRNQYTKQWDSPARLAPWSQCKQTGLLQLPPLPWKIWEYSSLEKNEFPSKKASNTGIWECCLTNQPCSHQTPGPIYLLTAELSSTTWHFMSTYSHAAQGYQTVQKSYQKEQEISKQIF
jgi:hypothetical protein